MHVRLFPIRGQALATVLLALNLALNLALTIALTIGLTATRTYAQSARPAPQTPQTASKPAATTTAAFSPEKAREIIDIYTRLDRANGTVLIAQKGRILFEEGYGFADIAAKKKNGGQTIFQLGSITKQFTAAIILQLQEEKKLHLRDRLSKYFPHWPQADSITLEELLTHTSGLYNYTRDVGFMMNEAAVQHTEEEMMRLFKDRKLDFVPGTQWAYSNTNYLLLGYIIGQVTGKPYFQVVRERILTPLKMTSSGFDFAHLSDPGKATGYKRMGNEPLPATIVDSTASGGAGALYSTVEDLYKWDRALYTSAVLRPADLQQAFTNHMNHYGFGWSVDSLFDRPTVSHSGGIFGFTSYILRFPTEETVIILLDNSGSPSLSEMGRSFAALVLGQPYQLPRLIAK